MPVLIYEECFNDLFQKLEKYILTRLLMKFNETSTLLEVFWPR